MSRKTFGDVAKKDEVKIAVNLRHEICVLTFHKLQDSTLLSVELGITYIHIYQYLRDTMRC